MSGYPPVVPLRKSRFARFGFLPTEFWYIELNWLKKWVLSWVTIPFWKITAFRCYDVWGIKSHPYSSFVSASPKLFKMWKLRKSENYLSRQITIPNWPISQNAYSRVSILQNVASLFILLNPTHPSCSFHSSHASTVTGTWDTNIETNKTCLQTIFVDEFISNNIYPVHLWHSS